MNEMKECLEVDERLNGSYNDSLDFSELGHLNGLRDFYESSEIVDVIQINRKKAAGSASANETKSKSSVSHAMFNNLADIGNNNNHNKPVMERKVERRRSTIGIPGHSHHININHPLDPCLNGDHSSHSLPISSDFLTDQYNQNNIAIATNTTMNTNDVRKERRNLQMQRVTDELIDLVCDTYAQESRVLIYPVGCDPVTEWGSNYSHSTNQEKNKIPVIQQEDDGGRRSTSLSSHQCEKNGKLSPEIAFAIRSFVMTLPPRYALGIESPGEVLVHMRLVALAKSNPTRAAVHVVSMDQDSGIQYKTPELVNTTRMNETRQEQPSQHNIRLITLCCADIHGLLQHATELLASGGNKIIDTNCMLSSEGIILIRFVINAMSSFRLEKIQVYMEIFLQASRGLLSPAKDTMLNTPISEHIGFVDPGDVHLHTFDRGPVSLDDHHECFSNSSKDSNLQDGVLFQNCYQSMSGFDYGSLSFQTSKESVPLMDIIQHKFADRQILFQVPTETESNHSSYNTVNFEKGSISGSIEAPNNNKDGVHRKKLQNRKPSADLGISLDGTSDLLNGSSPSRNKSQYSLDEVIIDGVIRNGEQVKIYRGYFDTRIRDIKSETKNNDDKKLIAFKVAVSNSLDEDATLQELILEGELVKKLRHKNVCKLIDSIKGPECICLAYEYCVGGTLAKLIQDKSRDFDYLPFAIDIANGMAYLHSQSIIHRDLKPSNIFLDHQNHAKIADFGMSIQHDGEYMTGETGTYRWMAPEVIRHEHYSINADIYSFGIVLWQLITRNPKPYDDLSPIQAAFASAKGNRPPIPVNSPNFIKRMIALCWREDQLRRPSSTNICMGLIDYANKAAMGLCK